MSDKTYTFNTARSGNSPPEITVVREEDLTQPQKDLLLGELINTWNNSPMEVQIKFMGDFLTKLPKKSDEFKFAYLKGIMDEVKT